MPSPDDTRLYIGGSFTTVNGQTRNRIAALDRATGTLISSFQPKPDATVRAIAATSDTVYFGGLLSAVGGVARTRVASVRASDGALLSWAPNAQGGSVHSLALSPDGSQLVIGGSFTTMNGSSNPGYGLASVNPSTGALLPFAANSLIRNGGRQRGDHRSVGRRRQPLRLRLRLRQRRQPRGRRPDRLERRGRKWVEDCHGDTYGSFPKGDVDLRRPATRTTAATCRTASRRPTRGPSTTAPRSPRPPPARSAATRSATSTGRATRPRPAQLVPGADHGTFTGQGQAGWNVTGNADYVTIGGEFPRVGSVAQQGLVRFAVPEHRAERRRARRSPARGSTRTWPPGPRARSRSAGRPTGTGTTSS